MCISTFIVGDYSVHSLSLNYFLSLASWALKSAPRKWAQAFARQLRCRTARLTSCYSTESARPSTVALSSLKEVGDVLRRYAMATSRTSGPTERNQGFGQAKGAQWGDWWLRRRTCHVAIFLRSPCCGPSRRLDFLVATDLNWGHITGLRACPVQEQKHIMHVHLLKIHVHIYAFSVHPFQRFLPQNQAKQNWTYCRRFLQNVLKCNTPPLKWLNNKMSNISRQDDTTLVCFDAL